MLNMDITVWWSVLSALLVMGAAVAFTLRGGVEISRARRDERRRGSDGTRTSLHGR